MSKLNIDVYFDELEKLESRRYRNLKYLREISEKINRCPASTKYHGSYAGGLLNHLILVKRLATILYRDIFGHISDSNFLGRLEFCALVHDLGKLGTKEHDFYLVNPDEEKRNEEPFIVNTQLVSMPHELRTLYWLNTLDVTDLTEDEYQALYFHAGPYTEGYLNAVRKESPLLVLLHTADNLSTKLIEDGK
jgi:hypothetical protein